MAGQHVVFWLLSILSMAVVGSLGTSTEAGVQNELLDRIRALEKQGQHHAEELQSMKSRLEEQDQKLIDQERTISDYKQRFEEQDQKLVNQESDYKQRFEEPYQNLVNKESVYKQRFEEQYQKLVNKENDYKQRFEEQDQKLVNNDKTISDNKQRLENQNNRLAVQNRTITDKKQRLHVQENRLAVQERAISDYKQTLADLEQAVAELKLKQGQSAEESMESNAESNNIQGIVRQNGPVHSNFRKATEIQMRELLTAQDPVAFHAVMTDGQVTHLSVHQTLVFPVVQTNLGGGYHNQTGLFIAPQPGVYIFSSSVMSGFQGRLEIDVDITKNGYILARAYAHGDSGHQDQGSVTVVTQLAAADEVSVRIAGPPDTSSYGDYFDSFMGCLLVPL